MPRCVVPRAILAIGALALISSSAARGQVLDQSHVVPAFLEDFAVSSDTSLAQTFTSGLTGVLSRVDVQLYKTTGATDDVTFFIRGTSAGVPNASDALALFQTTIPLSSLPTVDNAALDVGLTSVDVSSANIAVTPGQVLAISLSHVGFGAPPWVLWRSDATTYAGGREYVQSTVGGSWTPLDFGGPTYGGFRTFVTTAATVPEPSSLALLLGSGTTGALFAFRRRRR